MKQVKVIWKVDGDGDFKTSGSKVVSVADEHAEGYTMFSPIKIDDQFHGKEWTPSDEMIHEALEAAQVVRLAKAKAIEESREKSRREYEAFKANQVAENAARQAAEDAAFDKACKPQFNDAGIVVLNLYERLKFLSGLDFDRRFKNHIRRVTGIDPTKQGWYVFEGQFVSDKLVEFKRGERAVYMVAATSGSMKHHSESAALILFNGTEFEFIEMWDNDKSGWELLHKERVANLLIASAEPVIDFEPFNQSEIELIIRVIDAGVPTNPGQLDRVKAALQAFKR